MQKKSVGRFYNFGTTMRYLQDARKGFPIKAKNQVLDNINRFLKNIENLELNVTKRASRELYTFKQEMEKAENEALSILQATNLARIMNNIRLTLDAEIAGLFSFIVTPKHLDINKLLDNVPSLFAPNIFNEFPDIAKYDFIEAGKCIAFERSTAAAFHILRATEANLRHYYQSMIRKKRIKSILWGPLVADLQKRNKTKKYTTLNNHLDNIRLSFRNPTQHPDYIYDIHEVQDLFSVCIDVNNRMFKIIADNTPF